MKVQCIAIYSKALSLNHRTIFWLVVSGNENLQKKCILYQKFLLVVKFVLLRRGTFTSFGVTNKNDFTFNMHTLTANYYIFSSLWISSSAYWIYKGEFCMPSISHENVKNMLRRWRTLNCLLYAHSKIASISVSIIGRILTQGCQITASPDFPLFRQDMARRGALHANHIFISSLFDFCKSCKDFISHTLNLRSAELRKFLLN